MSEAEEARCYQHQCVGGSLQVKVGSAPWTTCPYGTTIQVSHDSSSFLVDSGGVSFIGKLDTIQKSLKIIDRKLHPGASADELCQVYNHSSLEDRRKKHYFVGCDVSDCIVRYPLAFISVSGGDPIKPTQKEGSHSQFYTYFDKY